MTPWVPVASSEAVGPGDIVDATLGDEDLVVWRTADGRPCVMEARCPHQWSHLGAEGAVDGDEVICTSHWWRFTTGGTGSILRTNGDREPQASIAVFPCEERDGRIWIRT